MEAFEKKQKEEATKNDHTAFQEVKWKTGQGHGKFKKESKDSSSGVALKKSLADLPWFISREMPRGL